VTTGYEERGLAVWAAPGQDVLQAYGRAMRDPALGGAVRLLAQGMADVASADRALDSVFKDAGRYVATMCVNYLDATDGLTLPGLKDVCRRTGLLSPGRGRALLLFLEHLGYAARLEGQGVIRYRLTETFRAAWRAHLAAALRAGARLEPEVALILDAGPQGLDLFGRHHAGGLITSVLDGAGIIPPFLRVFLHAYAGNQVMGAMIVDSEGGVFPPERVGPVTFSGLSRRFGVSRIHIKRMFQEGEREGLTTLDADGMVGFSAACREQMHFMYAAQLAQILVAAARTAAELGLPGRVAAVA